MENMTDKKRSLVSNLGGKITVGLYDHSPMAIQSALYRMGENSNVSMYLHHEIMHVQKNIITNSHDFQLVTSLQNHKRYF